MSTRWLKPLKITLYIVYTALCGVMIYMFTKHEKLVVFAAMQSAVYIWMFFILLRVVSKLHRVEFDDDYLYVLAHQQDLMIPLENIESVEIASLGGLYKVNLYHADQLGKAFYFKQSLWYPLNYKRCDSLVNVLRKKIDLAKARGGIPVSRNALHS